MKGKNHISKDSEKGFDKIQHSFMKKLSTRYRETVPQRDKGHFMTSP